MLPAHCNYCFVNLGYEEKNHCLHLDKLISIQPLLKVQGFLFITYNYTGYNQ